MDTKILILGAKGMLGCELMKVFKGFEVFGWDIGEIDITSGSQVGEKIGELKPDIVINAAAYTDVDGCETNKELAMKVNGEAVGFLASICKKIGAIFIHYSTDYVFHGDNPRGYREDDEPGKPLNIYGESKLVGEELLENSLHRPGVATFTSRSNRKFYLIRTSWLFGRNGKNFVETMIKLAGERDELKVVNDQHGKPTYALDLARRTRQLIENQLPCGIYHLTNEGVTTWYEFARKIFEIKNTKVKIEPCGSDEFPRPAKRPQYSILLNTKLPLFRSWEEALRDYLTFEINGDKI